MSDTDSSASDFESFSSEREFAFGSAPPLVIDSGSSLIKAGYSDDDKPISVFPSIVGHLRSEQQMSKGSQCKVGNDAIARKSMMCLRYPIECGLVKSWEDMSAIWSHTFHNELKVEPEDHAVMLTDCVENPRSDREKMPQIMFEKFDVPAMCVRNTAQLSMVSEARATGIVIESGYDVTRVVPICNYEVISHAIKRMDVGGRDLTEHLRTLLKKRGYAFPSSAETAILRGIKEKLASVAEDFEQDLSAIDEPDAIEKILAERWSREKELVREWCNGCLDTQTVRDIKEKFSYAADVKEKRFYVADAVLVTLEMDEDAKDAEEKYEMPDGNVITIGAELFRCIEPLFKPSLLGCTGPGLSQMVFDSIIRCGSNTYSERAAQHFETSPELINNVVLAGGTTMVRNFDARLQTELTSLLQTEARRYDSEHVPESERLAGLRKNTESKVSSTRKYGAWIGGSILCSSAFMKTDPQSWVSRDDYEECGGLGAIHRKQF